MEKPILFSTSMVQAILDGRKTQTRRVMKIRPPAEANRFPNGGSARWGICKCAYRTDGKLWVKETWLHDSPHCDDHRCGNIDHIWYRASEKDPDMFPRWRPSIFMPRWASRIALHILDVRVQRLQDIDDADACREGVDLTNTSIPGYAKERFRRLWNSINEDRGLGWDANPWVWVITFERVGE